MFTGIIEDVGTLVSMRPQGNGRRLRIRTAIPLHEVDIGDSIAVDGACLTAEVLDGEVFEAVAGAETLRRTTLGEAREGRRVHLERALQVGGRLDGHLVQGHVDGLGTLTRVTRERESWIVWVDAGPELSRQIATKGSICIDGVSLTVNEVDGTRFRVNIVPHTAAVTRFSGYTPGDRVNLETDVLAKYVERLLGAGVAPAGSTGLDWQAFARNGWNE